MQKETDTWKLVMTQPLPAWVIEKEANFHELIEEELKA
jgi:hypothetical protein